MKDSRIIFLRDQNKKPVGCLAFKTSMDNNYSMSISYQVTTLNPLDNFDKKMARQLTIGRLMDEPYEMVSSDFNEKYCIHAITAAIMKHISENGRIPRRSRQAANLWLKICRS